MHFDNKLNFGNRQFWLGQVLSSRMFLTHIFKNRTSKSYLMDCNIDFEQQRYKVDNPLPIYIHSLKFANDTESSVPIEIDTVS